MYSIGEFSKVTGLTVKTLRFYHDEGLLTPAWVDPQTGYRYYDARQIDKARVLTQLRGLEFPLGQIAEMLKTCDDESDTLASRARERSGGGAASSDAAEDTGDASSLVDQWAAQRRNRDDRYHSGLPV